MGNEADTPQIIARLERERCKFVHNDKDDKFKHLSGKGFILIVPRHREISFGVARDIAKKPGWV